MSVLKEKAKSILAVASITIKMEINVAIKVDFFKSFFLDFRLDSDLNIITYYRQFVKSFFELFQNFF